MTQSYRCDRCGDHFDDDPAARLDWDTGGHPDSWPTTPGEAQEGYFADLCGRCTQQILTESAWWKAKRFDDDHNENTTE